VIVVHESLQADISRRVGGEQFLDLLLGNGNRFF
jgi:hypothetical protein